MGELLIAIGAALSLNEMFQNNSTYGTLQE